MTIAKQNVTIQEQSLQITETRFKEGEVTELDVQQAKALLRDTQALIPRLEAALRRGRNGLAILLGMLPKEMDGLLEASGVIPEVPDALNAGAPSDLLRRRPDIRQAEHQLMAQSALIGVAKATCTRIFLFSVPLGCRPVMRQ